MTTEPTPASTDMAGEPPAPEGDQSQTVEVQIAAIGEAKEGDTVQFRVVSRDDQNGVASLAPVAPEAPETGGSDDMAAQFGKDKMQQA